MAFLDSLLAPGSPGMGAGGGSEWRECDDRPASGKERSGPDAPAERSTDNARLLWDRNASAVLGLNGPASMQEVRAAFRRLAREHHPDHSGSETEAFIRIREAYETLITRSFVLSEDRGCEGVRKDPHSRAQSDTHC
ncbi:MAG: J domain-containing protein [bacterium]